MFDVTDKTYHHCYLAAPVFINVTLRTVFNMILTTTCCIYAILCVVVQCNKVSNDYWKIRNELLETEKSMIVGGDINLIDDEISANDLLLRIKSIELRRGHLNDSEFYPAQHFFKSSMKINKHSRVFSVIKQMPKGACLHTHLTASASADFVFNMTYADNLYGCMYMGIFRLHFFEPGTLSDYCEWQLLKTLRNNSSFDDWLRDQLTLKIDNYEKVYTNAQTAWNKFKATFSTKYYFISYRPLFECYVYESLKEFYMDNITYVEFRGAVLPLYELNGTRYTATEFMEIFESTVQRFKNDYPQFLGIKYIYSYYRNISNTTFLNCINEYLQLKEQFSSLIAGFDLVGYEDEGRPLQEFVYELRKHRKDMKLFLHAGETNWYGYTDINLVDAVLLNSTRIAHGFSLHKHPEVMKLIKERDIAIEITPISNQVLKFIDDLRNHPAASLIARGFPLVIGNDDPGAWGANGVSYDWYMVFMAMTNEKAGLEFLKKLALNSIHYSSMENFEKNTALKMFKNQWQYFICKLNEMNNI